MAATAQQVKDAIQAITLTHVFNTKYKNIAGKTTFDAFFKEVNVELERKGCDSAKEDMVKSVIKQDFKSKFALGKPEAIGGTPIGYVAALNIGPPLPPVYKDLDQSYTAGTSDYKAVRADVARVLGIIDKTHEQHGKNFTGSQTLRQIIQNVTDKVEGKLEVPRVQAAILRFYGVL